jgi:hypothetical protein
MWGNCSFSCLTMVVRWGEIVHEVSRVLSSDTTFFPGRNRNSYRADGLIQSRIDGGAELQAVAPGLKWSQRAGGTEHYPLGRLRSCIVRCAALSMQIAATFAHVSDSGTAACHMRIRTRLVTLVPSQCDKLSGSIGVEVF